MAAKKGNPQVIAARQQAMQAARASGKRGQGVRQAGRQAAQSTRQQLHSPMPQPPPPSDSAGGGYYQYTPSGESQLNQPYQDALAQGAAGALPSMFQRYGQQGQLGDIYGQGAAQNLGGAQQGMGQLTGIGGQGMGLAGGTMGQYGQLMGNNMPIQQNIANEIQGIQSGRTDVDPAMVQQFNQQEQLLNEQLRRQLGPDYATSSAGIEALGRFQQGKQTAMASANYNRLQGLVGMQQGGLQNLNNQGINYGNFGGGVQQQQFGQGQQMGTMFGQNAMDLYNQGTGFRNQQLGGANQMLQNTAATQNLYAGVPQTMAQFGQAMSGQSGAAVNAQGPYQQDRFGQFQASQFPTKGEFTGQTLVNQGQLLNQSASAMGGGGGGGGGTPQFTYNAPQSSMGGGGGGDSFGGN